MIDQLVLVRHGETQHNVAGITQGWNDSALTPRGEAQVRLLGQRLASYHPTALFSSPLERAMTTARAIAATTGLEIQTLDELREMNYGDWEGKSFLDIRSDDAAAYRSWIDDPDCACPGGESHTAVLQRLQSALSNIIHGTGRPVVVSHGTSIRVAACALLGLPVTMSRLFAQDNAAMNIFLIRKDRNVLKVWNDATHCGRDEG